MTLHTALIQGNPPLFQATQNTHKFIHRSTNLEVDIVPFGEIGEPDQEITWPDSDTPMNVAGLAEALEHAQVEVIGDRTFNIVSIPAFIALKIMAWGDRQDRTTKDLEDIEFILTRYEDDDRIYTRLVNELADDSIKFLDAPSYLLGQDIQSIFHPKTLAQLDELLERLLTNLDAHYSNQSSFRMRLRLLQEGMRL